MSLSDYSDLEKEIEEVERPRLLPRGTEVRARIIAMREGVSEKEASRGVRWYQPVFDVPANLLALEFSGFFWDLADRDKLEPKRAQAAFADFKDFAAAFDIDYSRPFSWEEDLIGKEGWVILGIKKDEEWGDKNTVSKYVAGRKGSVPVAEDEVPF